MKRKKALIVSALVAQAALAASIVAARGADELATVDLVSLNDRKIGAPRFADRIEGSDGTWVRPKEGFRLVILPIEASAPRGRIVISNLDLSVVTEDGARYGAAAVGVDGSYAVPTDEYAVRLAHPCDEPGRMTVEAAFIVPTGRKHLRLRMAAPAGEVALD